MNILILDTETISINKPFTYNVGWLIRDTSNGETLVKKDYMVKQVWSNKPLFETAYYQKKKQLYIADLRSRKSKIKLYGFIMLDLIKDIKKYNINYAYAFNSPFDTGVLQFNCEWYKCTNPLNYIELIDIRGLINDILFSNDYRKFCVDNNLFTDNGNLSVNAESVYKFITNNPDFEERHTALADCQIESEIILHVLKKGTNIIQPKKVYNVVKSGHERKFLLNYKGKVYTFNYSSKKTIKGIIYLE